MMKNKYFSLIFFLFFVSTLNISLGLAATNNTEALGVLMKSLAQKEYHKIDFHESKSSSLLVSDIEIKGTMLFQHPDYLLKISHKPHQERFELKKGVVTIQQGDNEHRTLLLGDYPLLNAYLMAYTAVLDGDLNRLQQYYHLKFDQREYAWRLRLIPRLKEMSEYVKKMEFKGDADIIRSILVYEANGDVSTTKFFY